jgi:hypothetical protein
MRKFDLGLMGLMGLIGLVGCKATKVIEQVPVYIHDTTQTVRELHDSIYIDRWHTIEVKGDTVYWRDSISLVKWLVRTDTAYRFVEKPVVVSKTEITTQHMPTGQVSDIFFPTSIVCAL